MKQPSISPNHSLLSVQPPEKPLLRGWIHAISAPLTLAATIVLVVLAPTTGTKIASAIYMLCTLALFGLSAVYHRGNWGIKGDAILRRLDHSNIFLLIAGTYTPVAVGALNHHDATVLLSIVWAGALIGSLMHIFWIDAPRWIYTPIYVILGWVALWYLQPIAANAGWSTVWLLISGGLTYTLGAVFYGFQWPGRYARYFGFHEFFHACTIAGWTLMCIAAYFAILG
ncbi:hemolysin III family protein [Actinomycetaceae bacterium TAE3-ERU4]|nr:hemolysin III family protein [Actinomycetaceae bacterium TAE3-ERU4]